jgi:hypothetical protein
VLGILAREKDGFAQQRLLEGLEDPEKALVPPEKAPQLLSYDVHAAAYPMARQIVSRPPSVARAQALVARGRRRVQAGLRTDSARQGRRSGDAPHLGVGAPGTCRRRCRRTREIVLDATEPDEL